MTSESLKKGLDEDKQPPQSPIAMNMDRLRLILKRVESFTTPNVAMIRAKDGVARAPHETCLTQASDPVCGSALI